MARSEARVSVNIWDDPDFVGLNPTAQRLYLFLLSQKDLAHTGVLALRVPRWARKSAGLTLDAVECDLAALASAKFIVVDTGAGEVLVRALLRRDKVYRQPNVLRAAVDQLDQIDSAVVRAALLDELLRIAEHDDIPPGSLPILAEAIRALGGEAPPSLSGNPPRNPSPNPSGGSPNGSRKQSRPTPATSSAHRQACRDSPAIRDGAASGSNGSAKPTDSGTGRVSAGDDPSPDPSEDGSDDPTRSTPGERGVVTAVSRDSPFPNPRAVPLPAGELALVAPADAGTAQTILGEYLDHCRKRPPQQVLGQLGKLLKSMLAEGIDPVDVRRGMAAWHSKGLGPSALPSVVNEVMNAPRGIPAARNGQPRPSTTDQRVHAALTLAAQLEAQETTR